MGLRAIEVYPQFLKGSPMGEPFSLPEQIEVTSHHPLQRRSFACVVVLDLVVLEPVRTNLVSALAASDLNLPQSRNLSRNVVRVSSVQPREDRRFSFLQRVLPAAALRRSDDAGR